ncbi:MAG: class I SAM-dependent methyltransferase [Methanosarcina sp.]
MKLFILVTFIRRKLNISAKKKILPYFQGGFRIDCKKVIANYWNFRAATYKNGINSFDEEERRIWKQTLESFLPFNKSLKILDVGTGAGFLALLFAEMGHEVTGVDLSEGMLEKAKSNAENLGLKIDFSHGDAEKLPFEDNSFDLVVNKYLLWTLPQPSSALLEWKRVLKPGGKIFAIDGNWFDPRPDRYIKRLASEWAARLMKRNQTSMVFKNHYNPIKKSLPLFREINPENIRSLFSEMGFISTTINPLRGVQTFQKNKAPFLQKLLEDTPIFLIVAQKEKDRN